MAVNLRDLNPIFAGRLSAAVAAAEQATGQKASFLSGRRTAAQGVEIWNRATGGGRHAPSFPAARPGRSLHEQGMATDMAPGKVRDWIVAHAKEYGLAPANAKRGFGWDRPHIQLDRGMLKTPYDSTPNAFAAGAPTQALPPAQQAAADLAGGVPGGPPRTLRKGATDVRTGGAVTRLQQQLTDAGFDVGPRGIDGRFGKDTAAAVRAVERHYGLPTQDRGVAGPQVQTALANQAATSNIASAVRLNPPGGGPITPALAPQDVVRAGLGNVNPFAPSIPGSPPPMGIGRNNPVVSPIPVAQNPALTMPRPQGSVVTASPDPNAPPLVPPFQQPRRPITPTPRAPVDLSTSEGEAPVGWTPVQGQEIPLPPQPQPQPYAPPSIHPDPNTFGEVRRQQEALAYNPLAEAPPPDNGGDGSLGHILRHFGGIDWGGSQPASAAKAPIPPAVPAGGFGYGMGDGAGLSAPAYSSAPGGPPQQQSSLDGGTQYVGFGGNDVLRGSGGELPAAPAPNSSGVIPLPPPGSADPGIYTGGPVGVAPAGDQTIAPAGTLAPGYVETDTPVEVPGSWAGKQAAPGLSINDTGYPDKLATSQRGLPVRRIAQGPVGAMKPLQPPSVGRRIGIAAAGMVPVIGPIMGAIARSLATHGSLDNAQPYLGQIQGGGTGYARAPASIGGPVSAWGSAQYQGPNGNLSASMFTPAGAGWHAPSFSPVSGGPLYSYNPETHTYIDSRGREHPY